MGVHPQSQEFLQEVLGIPAPVQCAVARRGLLGRDLAKNLDLTEEAWDLLWAGDATKHDKAALVARPLSAAQRRSALSVELQSHALVSMVRRNRLTKDEAIRLAHNFVPRPGGGFLTSEVVALIREVHDKDREVFDAFDAVISAGERLAWLAELDEQAMHDHDLVEHLGCVGFPGRGNGQDHHSLKALATIFERRPHILSRCLSDTMDPAVRIAAAGSRHLEEVEDQAMVLGVDPQDFSVRITLDEHTLSGIGVALAANPRTQPEILAALAAQATSAVLITRLEERATLGSWFVSGSFSELSEPVGLGRLVDRALGRTKSDMPQGHAEDIVALLANPYLCDADRGELLEKLELCHVARMHHCGEAESLYNSSPPRRSTRSSRTQCCHSASHSPWRPRAPLWAG